MSATFRSVRALHPDGHVGRGNEIRTSKYRWYSFLPQNIWEQFHSRANLYFLVIAFLQCVPDISITFGKPTILLPLSIVVCVAGVKDLWEDIKRHRADHAENEREVGYCTSKSVDVKRCSSVPWKTVRPGDVLVVRSGELLPADLLLLTSSDSASSCFVETMNLDGETNLKHKESALPQSWEMNSLQSAECLRLEFEQPSAELYEFRGALLLDAESGRTEDAAKVGVSINNLLLRGSVLKTPWIVGLAVYCGHDTRIMRNSQESRFKLSRLDDDMNRIIVFIFVLEIALCIFAGLFYAIWEASPLDDALWYLMMDASHGRHPLATLLLKAGTWALQLSNMVPISLIVMLTSVKFAQGKLFESDRDCMDENNKASECHTSQVLESLGQITHVLSDKTGTLTCNVMKFKACSVGGTVYGLPNSSSTGAATAAQDGDADDSFVDFSDSRPFLEAAAAMNTQKQQQVSKRNADLLLNMALCHTVTVLKDSNSDAHVEVDRPAYDGSSPDELALVSAARHLGLAFRKATTNELFLDLWKPELDNAIESACGSKGHAHGAGRPRRLQFPVMSVCEFDNDRKRMSVIVQYPNKDLMLLVKGADTSMIPFLSGSHDQLQDHLRSFASIGLRTLVLAQRKLTEREYGAWQKQYAAALSAISEDRAVLVQKLAKEIEEQQKLELVGATAIEDMLQEGVPETIEHLRAAHISVWVLTGDKLETAINIGKSCKLLTEDMRNIELSEGMDLKAHLAETKKVLENHHLESFALTVTGGALTQIMDQADLPALFYSVAKECQSVLCCRVSPKQKSQVVALVKQRHAGETGEDPVTLAIGDGANDVAMINEAHVGVGLSGKEGAQAARAGDFAMGQFRFLERLVLIHGRESYRRNAVVVCYSFYKNALLCLPPFLYGMVMSFSGQPFYEQVLFQFFNVVFTCAPIIVFALFDRAESDLAQLLSRPCSYHAGRYKQYFRARVALIWLVTAALQAVLLTAVAFSTAGDTNADDAGLTSGDLWSLGAVVYMWVILGATVTLCGRMEAVFSFSVLVMIVSVLLHPLCMFTMDKVVGSQFLSGTFSFMYEAGFVRFFSETLLMIGAHFLVGEVLLMGIRPQVTVDTPSKGAYQELQEADAEPTETRRRLGSQSTDASRQLLPSPSHEVDPSRGLENFTALRDRTTSDFSQECSLRRQQSHVLGPDNRDSFILTVADDREEKDMDVRLVRPSSMRHILTKPLPELRGVET